MNTTDLEREARVEELPGWGWAFALGVALVMLGAVALSSAGIATLATIVTLGVIMLIAGVVQVVHAFKARARRGILLHLAAGILYGVVGLLMVARPLMGAMALTLLLASFFIVMGSFRLIGAVMERFPHWGLSAVSGALSIALGVIVYAQFPLSSLWLVGTLLGVDLIFSGSAWIAIALGQRRLRTAEPARS